MEEPRMQSLRDAIYSPSPLQPCASSGASSEVLYTPQVKDDLTPKIDQVFASLEDAHRFYNDYAREAGFGVRIHSMITNTIDPCDWRCGTDVVHYLYASGMHLKEAASRVFSIDCLTGKLCSPSMTSLVV